MEGEQMKVVQFCMPVLVALFAVVAFNPAFASDPMPITADEAFDGVQRQVFPGTDASATVVLVDVRDPQEVLSSGAAAKVTEIAFLNGKATVEPEWGKVRLVHEGKFIEYDTHGRYKRAKHGRYNLAKVDTIKALETEAIAYNIKLWDQTDSGFDLQPTALQVAATAFAEDLVDLIDETDPDVIIVYCRTGGRSSFAGQLILNGSYTYDGNTYTSSLFPGAYEGEVYEIDDPYGTSGRGGFSGSDYSNVFNGYAGFPGRLTDTQEVPSASWKDSGLPVKRAAKPLPE
jgi:rhodanese-related sulfurtransferase